MNRLHANDFHEWAHEQPMPVELHVAQGDLSKQLRIDDSVPGFLEARFSSFQYFLVSQLQLSLDDATYCTCHSSGETIGLYFNLSGSCSSTKAENSAQVISPGQQSIYFSSGYKEQVQLQPERGKLQSLEINFPSHYYINLLAGYSPHQNQFISAILKGNDPLIHTGFLPITIPMKWIINTLQQCTRTGALKRLFFEAKILELLMLQIEQYEFYTGEQSSRVSRSTDLDAIMEAKSILEKKIDTPPTIKNLSRMVGINEFNLKKGFKDTFNTTIYGFVNGLKMQQARQLIIDGHKSIQEIAMLSGYKNPQHFTVAFKKYFGQLPSKIKTIVMFFLASFENLAISEEFSLLGSVL